MGVDIVHRLRRNPSVGQGLAHTGRAALPSRSTETGKEKEERQETEMIKAQFSAFCPLEIGDKIRDTTGKLHTITDIACVHYVRTGKVEFRFELDRSGQYAPIEIQDAPPEVRVHLIQR